jgi:hypothetical protein
MERKVMSKDDRLFAPFPIEMDEHPKIFPLSDAAFRALFEATFYSRRMLSDGFLDERVVLKRWGKVVADELSNNDPQRPSWVRVEGGWQVHDFAKHHPTKAEIVEKREQKSVAGRANGLRSGEARRTKAQQALNEIEPTVNEIELIVIDRDIVIDKDRDKELKSVVPRKRGTRIPEPFMLTNEMRSWASSRVPGVDVNTATEKFVNYWRASTKNATKLDWTATWNNWLLSDFETRVQNRKPTPEERAFRTLGLATDVDMGEISE